MNDATLDTEPASSQTRIPNSNEPEEFFPRGAIAFFVSLLIGFAVIWAGLYVLLVHRQFHP